MIIFSTDFDGTLCENKWPDIGKPNTRLIWYLIAAKSNGHKIILNTMREGEMLDKAVDWCKLHGLEFDAINDNLQVMKDFYGNNPRKIYADYYLDDHNALCGLGKKLPGMKK